MLSGTSVEVDVGSFQNDIVSIDNKDDVLTYLIHLGYLAYLNYSGRQPLYRTRKYVRN